MPILRILTLILLLALPQLHAAETREKVSVGIIDTFNQGSLQDTQTTSTQTLIKNLKQYDFEVKVLNTVNPAQALRDHPVDFIYTSPGMFYELRSEGLVNYVATLKALQSDDPAASQGSVFVVLKDREDIQTLADLKGKAAAANQPNSFAGWIAALAEIKKAGFNPDKFFSEVLYRHFTYPDAFALLQSGAADAAVLPSCLMEQLAADNLIRLEDFRVINEKPQDVLRCAHSTDLYPGHILAARENLSPKLVWEVTSVLLNMGSFDGYEWTISQGFSKVGNVYKELAIGPYSYLRDRSLTGIWARWKVEISVFAAVILFLILNSLYLHLAVKRRTRELAEALERQINLEKEAAKSREKFLQLERLGIISQMSGMFAHEVQQPLLAINNYLSGLRIYLERKGKNDAISDKSLEHMAYNCERIGEIVQRVRGYAKAKRGVMAGCDLAAICRQALSTLKCGQYRSMQVDFRCLAGSAEVLGDNLELELLVLNLLRNACSAAETAESPSVTLTLSEADTRHWQITVTDNGPKLTEAEFARLSSLGESLKSEGLGIGLSLVRGIADAHGATLKFRQLDDCGIAADVTIEKAEKQPC